MRTLLPLALLLVAPAYAADPAGDAPSAATKAAATADAKKDDPDTAKASATETAQPVKRSIRFRGGSLNYVATPGTLTIRNDDGEPVASMFYTAYTIPGAGGRARPLTFLFNGGPGSSTMWLHMGSFGPMKVDASIPEMERLTGCAVSIALALAVSGSSFLAPAAASALVAALGASPAGSAA